MRIEGNSAPRWLTRRHLHIGFLLVLYMATVPQVSTAAEQSQVSVWNVPNDTLYFIPGADVVWSKQPRSALEWIQLSWSCFRPEPADMLTQDAIQRELAGWMRNEWLPNPDFTQLLSDMGRSPAGSVFFNAYYRSDAAMVVCGTLGERCLVYVEQPLPLSKSSKQLQVADIVAPDVMRSIQSREDASRPMILGRKFTRYRAFAAEGPYDLVSILLIDVIYVDRLNLQSPQH